MNGHSLGPELTAVACSRSFLLPCARKCLTQTVDCGWKLKGMRFTPIPTRTPQNVCYSQIYSLILTLTFISEAAHNLNWYRFIGRILGKALYKGILVEVAFAGFFLAKVIAVSLITSYHVIDQR